jgi:hypothetical protein
MTVQQLSEVGVSVPKDLVWGPHNRRTLHIDGLSDRLQDILRVEGTFSISEIKRDKSVKNILKETKVDDTANTVKDATTGQVSIKGTGT